MVRQNCISSDIGNRAVHHKAWSTAFCNHHPKFTHCSAFELGLELLDTPRNVCNKPRLDLIMNQLLDQRMMVTGTLPGQCAILQRDRLRSAITVDRPCRRWMQRLVDTKWDPRLQHVKKISIRVTHCNGQMFPQLQAKRLARSNREHITGIRSSMYGDSSDSFNGGSRDPFCKCAKIFKQSLESQSL